VDQGGADDAQADLDHARDGDVEDRAGWLTLGKPMIAAV
jgi:hypothetical protein